MRLFTTTRILACIALLAFGGCAHSEKLSDQPAQALIQIQNWVPVGTPLADARQIMKQHRFSCSEMTNSSFGDLKLADFLYCDYRVADSHVTPVVLTRWQVALVLHAGKVSDVLVTTGLIGP